MNQPLFVISILTIATVSFSVKLETVYKWKWVDYLWQDEAQKTAAINSGNYDPSSCVLYDMDRAPEDCRTFVTSVRIKGVPASLMTVSNETGPGGPLLKPYPSWLWYNENDCNGIINVYRVSIKCNHIFVLDCGKIGDNTICPPKLLIFNLKNDQLVERIDIPPHIANNENGTGLLVTPLAYIQDCRCLSDFTVFIADVTGYGLIIYNNKLGFCRIESKYMMPTETNFTINNESFTLNDGILGLTIMTTNIKNKSLYSFHKKNPSYAIALYYSPLAGDGIYKMDKRDFCTKCPKLTRSKVDKLTQLAGTLSGQTGPIESNKCAIFFSNIPETSILCQDTGKEFNSTNTEIIAQNSELLQFPSGMKISNCKKEKKLCVLTNRLQLVMNDKLNLNETNFRILCFDLRQIQNETNCFASCSQNRNEPGHHIPRHVEPWHDKPWNDRPWHGRSRYYSDEHNERDGYDKLDKNY